MKLVALMTGCAMALIQIAPTLKAENTVIAEDDASDGAYGSGWDNSKNGGSGFSNWTLTTEGNDSERHSGFFLADIKYNPDCKGIAKSDKAFGFYANGPGFEQAVAYRNFDKSLEPGDSFSVMMQNRNFEKKFEKDEGVGSIGFTLRSGTAASSVNDYNKDAVFEIGYYQGKPNYQIYDGSGDDKSDTGIPLNDSGISVTVIMTGPDTYDLEIQTLSDKKVTKLSGRKFRSSDSINSVALFDRNSEKYDAFFNQLQIARPTK